MTSDNYKFNCLQDTRQLVSRSIVILVANEFSETVGAILYHRSSRYYFFAKVRELRRFYHKKANLHCKPLTHTWSCKKVIHPRAQMYANVVPLCVCESFIIYISCRAPALITWQQSAHGLICNSLICSRVPVFENTAFRSFLFPFLFVTSIRRYARINAKLRFEVLISITCRLYLFALVLHHNYIFFFHLPFCDFTRKFY